MCTRLIFLLLSVIQLNCFPQERPKDYLSNKFHKERRDLLREKLPANSVAVFFANPVRNRANDVDYIYHQDPNFFYLSGYKEPHALLLIFKEMQNDPSGDQYNEIIFVQPRNARAEMWTGRRLGDLGTKDQLAFEQALNNTEFASYEVDWGKFDKIMFYDFKNDERDTGNKSDLYDLIKQFKQTKI